MSEATSSNLSPRQIETIDDYVRDAEEEYRTNARTLARNARRLAERMSRLAVEADEIAEQEVNYERTASGINGLGEVGSYGSSVDLGCAAVARGYDRLRRLRYVARRIKEQA